MRIFILVAAIIISTAINPDREFSMKMTCLIDILFWCGATMDLLEFIKNINNF